MSASGWKPVVVKTFQGLSRACALDIRCCVLNPTFVAVLSTLFLVNLEIIMKRSTFNII